MKSSLPALLLAVALASPALSQTPPSPLPIRQVTLFTSGVAYIERGGAVTGDASVPLTFRTGQINDILKSLTLRDAGGQVQPVTYGACDPIGRTLQSFAIDITQPQSRADLLNRLRGAEVTVTTAGKAALSGQVVSVESKNQTTRDTTTTVETLNLLGADGLQSVRLDDITGIKLRDARLDREFREALTLLASGADDQRRQVTLHFAGEGRRDVHVGYIAEAPLWKVSYRLLLDTPGKAYLQGWALVENTTDEDWAGIRLALVSGRPISFIQDLYQPLYLPRPIVANDVIASPYPQTHDDDLEAGKSPQTAGGSHLRATLPFRDKNGVLGAVVDEPRRFNVTGDVGLIAGNKPSPLQQGAGARATFGAPESGVVGATTEQFGLSVTAQAQGQDVGEQYAYNITTPITLPRQQAAMIPIVAQDIAADKVSLYNADADPRYPLNAIRLKNTTALHFKGGPITLFDGDVYAGDAKTEDIPPGDTRLISYAVDLSILGERQATGMAQTQTALAIHRGVLTITVRRRQETTYHFKSKSESDKTVLVEHPFNAAWTLIAPAASAERTASLYRFAVPVPGGKTATLQVVTEQPVSSTLALLDGDLNAIAVYANGKDIPLATRQVLSEIVGKRRHIQELSDQASAAEASVSGISQEQDRIRKNMAALDRTSALYRRYVAELDAQETQIHDLRASANRLRQSADQAQNAFHAYLDNLELPQP